MVKMREKYTMFKASKINKSEYRRIKELDSVANEDNISLLYDCSDMYSNLREFRLKYKRYINYGFGKQWEDRIIDPDNPHTTITESDYIKRQGKVPLVNNLIRKTTKSIIGLYRQNATDSIVVARDRDEQKYSEMMSIALKYAYQTNNLDMIDARTLEEFLYSGAACQSVRYKWNRERQIYDVCVEMENLNRIFFNSDITDPRMKDLTTFGVLHDMTMQELLEAFAHSKEQAARIHKMFSNVSGRLQFTYKAFDGKRFFETDFFNPSDGNKYRVIEVWTKESKNRIRAHDTLEGTITIYEEDEINLINQKNKERLNEFLANGVETNDIPLIDYEWFVDRFWYSRYLTPFGDILYECETPFAHNQTPFVFIAYPLINSEVHPFVEDFIDQQRYINRYITMLDFIRGASAKGVLIYPEEAIGQDGKEDILDQWKSPNGVIFAKTKGLGQMPTAINTNAINASDYEMIKLQMNMFDEASGVHGALQGSETKAGTPASLYAQQAQNSSVNLIDVLQTFSFFKKERDYRMIKTIQQFYDEPRYINIAGKDYSEEAKNYNPEKIRNTEFDNVLSDMPSTPVYRSIVDGILGDLLKQGLIDLEMYMENSSLPFADKILESIKKRKDEIEQGKMPQQLQTPEIAQQLQQGMNPKAAQMIG